MSTNFLQIWEIFIETHVCALPKCLCVTSCFVNSSLILQGIHIFFLATDSPEFQLLKLLSQKLISMNTFVEFITSFIHTKYRGPFLSVCYRPVFYLQNSNGQTVKAKNFRYQRTYLLTYSLKITSFSLLPFSRYNQSKLKKRLCVTCVSADR